MTKISCDSWCLCFLTPDRCFMANDIDFHPNSDRFCFIIAIIKRNSSKKNFILIIQACRLERRFHLGAFYSASLQEITSFFVPCMAYFFGIFGNLDIWSFFICQFCTISKSTCPHLPTVISTRKLSVCPFMSTSGNSVHALKGWKFLEAATTTEQK